MCTTRPRARTWAWCTWRRCSRRTRLATVPCPTTCPSRRCASASANWPRRTRRPSSPLSGRGTRCRSRSSRARFTPCKLRTVSSSHSDGARGLGLGPQLGVLPADLTRGESVQARPRLRAHNLGPPPGRS
nr:MAG: MC145.1R [Molluscum contagiosum virus]